MTNGATSAPASAPMLSFCMPVYNFAAFIPSTVSSILEQSRPSDPIEVVILDGGSTDETPAVAASLCSADSRIRYVRHAERGGIDRDLDACVRHARGTYCWLFSGDDLLKSGALEEALRRLEHGHDAYICEHDQCDLDMNRLGSYPIFTRRGTFDVDLARPDQRDAYLSAARNTEALFSFMTGVIVRRKLWIETPCPEVFMDSCWGHVARLLEAARHRLSLSVVGEVWVDRRGDNDSFRSTGFVRRLALAIDGYNALATHYFGEGSLAHGHVRRMLRGDLPLSAFMLAKVLCRDARNADDHRMLDRLVREQYLNAGWQGLLARGIFMSVPAAGWQMLRTVRHHWRQISRRQAAGTTP